MEFASEFQHTLLNPEQSEALAAYSRRTKTGAIIFY
jgi:hypothetical protein